MSINGSEAENSNNKSPLYFVSKSLIDENVIEEMEGQCLEMGLKKVKWTDFIFVSIKDVFVQFMDDHMNPIITFTNYDNGFYTMRAYISLLCKSNISPTATSLSD